MTLAILLALLAAVSWGVSSVLARLGLEHMRSTTGTVISLVAGVVVVGALAVPLYGSEMFALPAVTYAWFGLLGLISYPLGRLLNFAGVRLAGVGRATPILAGAPLVAATLGVVLGGETVTLPLALGTGAIVAGVVLIVTERAR